MYVRASASSGSGGGSLQHAKTLISTPTGASGRNVVTPIKANDISVIYCKSTSTNASYQSYAMCFIENGQVVDDTSYFKRNMTVSVNAEGYIVIDNAYNGYSNVDVSYGYLE